MNNLGIILLLIITLLIGYNEGVKTQKVRYFERNEEILKEIAQKREEYREKTELHVSSQHSLLLELQALKDKYETDTTNIKSDYSDRLLKSEERSNIYRQRLSNTNEQCSALAEHASKLDRSLVEGRQLVRELSANIRQCGVVFTHATEYLDNDRNHLNGR